MGLSGLPTYLDVAFVTVQFENVRSGPGTFTNYLQRSRDLPLRLTFFTEDVSRSDQLDLVKVCSRLNLGPMNLVLRSGAYYRSVKRRERSQSFDLVWYNTAPPLAIFSAVLGHASPLVLMVSDYSNAISKWPWSSRTLFGLKRSISRSGLRILERFALRRACAIVTNSEYLRDVVITEYGLKSNRVFVLPKAVDTKRFSFRSETRDLSVPLRVLFLKSDFRLGGLADLFVALSTLPYPSRLTVAGPQMEEAQTIERLARAAKFVGDFDFVGSVPRDQVPELIRSHDVLCVPSHAEALGVVFLEGLALGVPVVGTKVGGIPEVLDNGNCGWLAKPGDPDSLRNAIRGLVEDKVERTRKTKMGRVHVMKYAVGNLTSLLPRLAHDIVALSKLDPN